MRGGAEVALVYCLLVRFEVVRSNNLEPGGLQAQACQADFGEELQSSGSLDLRLRTIDLTHDDHSIGGHRRKQRHQRSHRSRMSNNPWMAVPVLVHAQSGHDDRRVWTRVFQVEEQAYRPYRLG